MAIMKALLRLLIVPAMLAAALGAQGQSSGFEKLDGFIDALLDDSDDD